MLIRPGDRLQHVTLPFPTLVDEVATLLPVDAEVLGVGFDATMLRWILAYSYEPPPGDEPTLYETRHFIRTTNAPLPEGTWRYLGNNGRHSVLMRES